MDSNEVVIKDGSGNVLLSVEVKQKTNPTDGPTAPKRLGYNLLLNNDLENEKNRTVFNLNAD